MAKLSKEQAVKALKEQIKTKKASMSQKELEEMSNIANRILKGEKNIPAPNSQLPKGAVPYDKESAIEALKLFIKNSDDPEKAQEKILKILEAQKETIH